ncbi:hypothetical protein GCM10009631_07390 [Corynebacterium glaucum]
MLPEFDKPRADSSPVELREFFRGVAQRLAGLAQRDPRMAGPLYAARAGEEYAGDLRTDFLGGVLAGMREVGGRRVVVKRMLPDAEVTCTIETEDAELARALAGAAWEVTGPQRHAIDFYAALAAAKRACRTADRAALEPALRVLAQFGPEFAAVSSAGDFEVVEAWLPREVSELVPAGWVAGVDPEFDAAFDARLLDGLNALPGARFVAVSERGGEQAGELSPGQVSPGELSPVDLGAALTAETLRAVSAQGAQTFRGWI